MSAFQEPQTKTGQNLGVTGGVFTFLFGAWVGSVLSQRYHIPRVPGFESRHDGSEHREHTEGEKDNCRFRHPKWRTELRERIEKMKEFEKSYRRLPESDKSTEGVKPKEPWGGEWSE